MYLGIDLGTSGVKILLMNEEHQVISTETVALPISRPKPLWSEQDPEDWWQATVTGINTLKKSHSKALSSLRAIGLSGQMHGATLLDKHGNILRPAMLWNDGRAMTQCETLLQREPKAQTISGNLIMPGFTAPKVLWVYDNEPDIFAQIDKVLLPKDYLRFRLSGDFSTDLSDASGTSWLNVKDRCWSEEMLTATKLSIKQMPTLHEGTDITGTISSDVAELFGVPKVTKIVAGGGDNAASAISVNVTQPGRAFLSLGTSGVYFVADNDYHPNPEATVHTFCHCLPNTWHEMTVHLSAACCLDWLANLLQRRDIGALLDEAHKNESTDTPIFLPYLSGERTPHNDPYARGVFFGMTHNTKAHHLAQSTLEGVAFALAQGQQAMEQAGVAIDEISVIGGGAKSYYWGEILSAALQKPLAYYKTGEVGAAYGAARLAWLALHPDCSIENAFPPSPIDHIIKPSEERQQRFARQQIIFNELYQQLKGTFAKAYHHNFLRG